MPISTGTRLGPYEIVGKIGAGGMGVVYRAKDPRLGREVAVKVLPPDFAMNDDRMRRFEAEARTTGGLNHPNLVSVFDVGRHEGSLYLVMELLEGQTLRERLGGKSLPFKRALEIARGMAEGLAAAHGKGIVHRDLKPENIFLTKDGRVKILDFGLAKTLSTLGGGEETPTEALGCEQETEAGQVLGTIGYMSPEQVRGGRVDARSDLFALGVILWEMLTGLRPFHGASVIETLNAILKDEPPPLDSVLRVPPVMERVLLRCLSKEPEHRFQSAHDLAFALDNWSGPSQAAISTERVPLIGRRMSSAWLTAIAVTLFLIMGGFLFGSRLYQTPRPVFERLTPSPRLVTSARWLPDGKGVAFTSRMDGGERSELCLLNPGRPLQVLDVKQCQVLAISPSGDIGLLMEGPVPKLAVLPATGGAPRIVLEEPHWQSYGMAWTRDGRDIIIKHGSYQGRPVVGFVFKGKLIYEAPSSHQIGDFVISPDGEGIAFLESRPEGRGLTVVNLGGNLRFHRTLPNMDTGNLLVQGGIYYVVETPGDGTGGSQVSALDAHGKVLGVRHRFATRPVLWDVNPKGDMLICPEPSDRERELIRWLEPGAIAERVIGFGRRSYNPMLSQTGDLLAFTQMNADGLHGSILHAGEPAAMLVGSGSAIALSPDGQRLLCATDSGSTRSLRLYSTGAGEARDLPGKWSNLFQAWFLPDGAGLLLVGIPAPQKPGDAVQIYQQSLSSGELRVYPSKFAGVEGPPSPDGRLIFAKRPPGEPRGWHILELATGRFQAIPASCEGLQKPCGWSQDGNSIWYFKWPINRSRTFPLELWQCSLKTGKTSKVRELPGPPRFMAQVLNTLLVNPKGDSCSYSYAYPLDVPTDIYRLSGLP